MSLESKPVILFVDNEINSSSLSPLVEFLSKEYTLLKSDTIESAKHKFKYDTESIDIVILDIHFKDNPEGGINLLEKMRKTDPYLPIGMITQYDHSTKAFESGQKQATFYLPKPQDGINESFLHKLNEAIEHSLKKAVYLYDRELMKNCNSDYADEYDEKEYSKPGTIAFCYWEDSKVMNAIKNSLSGNSGDKLKILDIGCGTGRFEVLIKKFFQTLKIDDYEVTGIDFSGKMLLKAKEKIEDILQEGEIPPEPADNEDKPQIKFKRGFAELLPFDNGEFSLAIAGFGIPSFTKFNHSIPETYRVLKDEGLAIFTVYNKDALFHKISDYFFPDLKEQCPLASRVVKARFRNGTEQGFYKLAPQGDESHPFPIQAFTKNELIDILNRFKFEAIEINSFPILNSIYPLSYIKSLSDIDNNAPANSIVEYGPQNNPKIFSRKLYDADINLTRNEINDGYYITAIAKKYRD
jgi:ubiquinone/menaquinone biosynthesis C-methylase UbiE/ActR/RegA family two-component response regulator